MEWGDSPLLLKEVFELACNEPFSRIVNRIIEGTVIKGADSQRTSFLELRLDVASSCTKMSDQYCFQSALKV